MKTIKLLLLFLLCGGLLFSAACRSEEDGEDYFEFIHQAYNMSFEPQDGKLLELHGSFVNIKNDFYAWYEAGEIVPIGETFEEAWLYRLIFNFNSQNAVNSDIGTRVEVLVGESLLQIGDRVYRTQGDLSHNELLEWLDMQYAWQAEQGY